MAVLRPNAVNVYQHFRFETMKRIYTLFMICAVLVGFQSPFAQLKAASSFEFTDAPQSTILAATTDDTEIVHLLHIKNNSSTTKTVRVRREIKELAPNHKNLLCFANLCMASTQDLSITTDLKAGEVTSSINALNPKIENIFGNPGTSRVVYVVYDEQNPSDQISIEFTYVVSPTTDVELPFDLAPINILSNAFPSPAYDVTRIDYNIAQHYNNASITLYNLIGNPLQTFRIDMPKGNVVVQTASLPPGVYFYSIVADGKKLATKKLVVKH